MAEIGEDMKFADVQRRLSSTFPQLPAAEVASIIAGAYAKLEQSPIRDFVPLFVERNARARLDQLGTMSPAH